MLKEGERAPLFELPDLSGAMRSSSARLAQGRALFVLYKASCPVCQMTLPFFDRMAASGSIPVTFISQDDARTAAQFNQNFGIGAAPTLIESRGYPVSNAFGIESVPTMFLVEAGGEIAQAWSGFSKADMEAFAALAGTQAFTAEEAARVPVFKPG